MGTSFNETIEYFAIFTLYLVALFLTDCTELACPALDCSGCTALRLLMTVHLMYYNFKWLYKICRLVWRKSVEILRFLRQVSRGLTPGARVCADLL